MGYSSSTDRSKLANFVAQRLREALNLSRIRLFGNRVDLGQDYTLPVRDVDLDSGDTLEAVLVNPEDSGVSVDLSGVEVSGSQSAEVSLYRDVTSVDGDETQLINKNGYFEDDAESLVYLNPEYDNSQEAIFSEIFGVQGSPNVRRGGVTTRSIDTTLPPGSTRLIVVESKSDNNDVRFSVDVSERPPSDAELEQLE